MQHESWPTWLSEHREALLAARTQYEWTFANRILSSVNAVDPSCVVVHVG